MKPNTHKKIVISTSKLGLALNNGNKCKEGLKVCAEALNIGLNTHGDDLALLGVLRYNLSLCQISLGHLKDAENNLIASLHNAKDCKEFKNVVYQKRLKSLKTLNQKISENYMKKVHLKDLLDVVVAEVLL